MFAVGVFCVFLKNLGKYNKGKFLMNLRKRENILKSFCFNLLKWLLFVINFSIKKKQNSAHQSFGFLLEDF